jgi:hypothetical protein
MRAHFIDGPLRGEYRELPSFFTGKYLVPMLPYMTATTKDMNIYPTVITGVYIPDTYDWHQLDAPLLRLRFAGIKVPPCNTPHDYGHKQARPAAAPGNKVAVLEVDGFKITIEKE